MKSPAIPNGKPTIALTARPRANVRGSLTLAYKLADQYGVASAEADFARPLIDGKAPHGPLAGRAAEDGAAIAGRRQWRRRGADD